MRKKDEEVIKKVDNYLKLIIEILQNDVKEGNVIIEKQEVDADKSKVIFDFLFMPKCCSKKMKVEFDYNELSKKILCKKDYTNLTNLQSNITNS